MEGEMTGKSSEIKRRRSNGVMRPSRFTIDGATTPEDSKNDEQSPSSSESDAHGKKRRQTFMYAIPENSDTTDSPQDTVVSSHSPSASSLDYYSVTSSPLMTSEGDVTPRQGRSQSLFASNFTAAIGVTSGKVPEIRSSQSPTSKKRLLKLPVTNKNAKTLSLPNPHMQQPPAFERAASISAEIRNDQRSPNEVSMEKLNKLFNQLNEKVKEKFKVIHYLEKEFTASDDFATIDKIASKHALKKMSKDQKKQQNILLEFLNSERKQTFNLKLLAQVFEPVLRSSSNSNPNQSSPQFPELSRLIDFHFMFYTKLLSCVTSDYVIQDVGPVFIEMFEKLDYRSRFADYYIWISCKTLKAEKVRKLEEDYRSLLKKRSLRDLLASEFQRATKYKLLLEGVLNCCLKTGDSDKNLFEQALKSVISLVAGIDKDKGLQDYRIFISKVDRSEILHAVESKDQWKSTESKDQSSENVSTPEVKKVSTPEMKQVSITDMKCIKLQESEPIKYGTYFVLFKFLYNKNKYDSMHVNQFKKCLFLVFPNYLIFIETDHFTEKMTWKVYLDKEKVFKSVIETNNVRHASSFGIKSLNDEQAEMVKDQGLNFTVLTDSLIIIVYVSSSDEREEWKTLLSKIANNEVKIRERSFSKLQKSTPPTDKSHKDVYDRIARPQSMIVTDLDAANLDFGRSSGDFQTEIHQSKSTTDKKQWCDSNSEAKKKSSVASLGRGDRISVSMSDISNIAQNEPNEDHYSEEEEKNEEEDHEYSDLNNFPSFHTSSEHAIELESSPAGKNQDNNNRVEKVETSSEMRDSNPLPEIITTEYINSDAFSNDNHNGFQLRPQSEVSSSDDKSEPTVVGNEQENPRSSTSSIRKRLSFFGSSRFYTGSVNLDRSQSSCENEDAELLNSNCNDDCTDHIDSKSPAKESVDEKSVDRNFSKISLLIQNLDEKVKNTFQVCDYRDENFNASHDFTTVDKLLSEEVLESMTEMQKRQQNILLQFLNNERKQTSNLKLMLQVFQPVLRPSANASSNHSNDTSLTLFPEVSRLIEFHFAFYARLLSCVTSDYVIQDVGPVFIDMFEKSAYQMKFAQYYEWSSSQVVNADQIQALGAETAEMSLKGQNFHDLINSEFEVVQRYACLVTEIQDSATGCSREEVRFLTRVSEAVSNEVQSIMKFKRNFDYKKLVSNLEVSGSYGNQLTVGDDYAQMNSFEGIDSVDLRNVEPVFYGLHFVMINRIEPVVEDTGVTVGDKSSPELKKFLVILLPRVLILVECNPESGKLVWSRHIDKGKTISSSIPIDSIQQVTSEFPVSLDDFQVELLEKRLLNFSCVCENGLQLMVFVSNLEERNNWMSAIEDSMDNVQGGFSRNSSFNKSVKHKRPLGKNDSGFSTQETHSKDEESNSSIDASSFIFSEKTTYTTSVVVSIASSTLKPSHSSTGSFSTDECVSELSSDERLARISDLRSQVISILKESFELARSVFDPDEILEPEKLTRAHQFVVDEQLFCLVDRECWLKQFDSPLMSLGQLGTSDATDISDVILMMKDENEQEAVSEVVDLFDSSADQSGQHVNTTNVRDDAIEKCFREYFKGKHGKSYRRGSLPMKIKSITTSVINSLSAKSGSFDTINEKETDKLSSRLSSSVSESNFERNNHQENRSSKFEEDQFTEQSVSPEKRGVSDKTNIKTEDDHTEYFESETKNDETDKQKLDEGEFEPEAEESGEGLSEVGVPDCGAPLDKDVEAENESRIKELGVTGLCNNANKDVEETDAGEPDAETTTGFDGTCEQENPGVPKKIGCCRVPTYMESVESELSYDWTEDSDQNTTDDLNLEDEDENEATENVERPTISEKPTNEEQENDSSSHEVKNLLPYQQSLEDENGPHECRQEVEIEKESDEIEARQELSLSISNIDDSLGSGDQ